MTSASGRNMATTPSRGCFKLPIQQRRHESDVSTRSDRKFGNGITDRTDKASTPPCKLKSIDGAHRQRLLSRHVRPWAYARRLEIRSPASATQSRTIELILHLDPLKDEVISAARADDHASGIVHSWRSPSVTRCSMLDPCSCRYIQMNAWLRLESCTFGKASNIFLSCTQARLRILTQSPAIPLV